MRVKNRLSRVAATVGAVALGAVGLLGVGTVAYADPAFGNIDPEAEGSITIHKFMSQPTDANKGNISTGETSPGDFVDPVKGVVFTAYQLGTGEGAGFVPLDLTVPSNWDSLGHLIPSAPCEAPAGYTKGSPIEFDPTDGAGIATVEDLEVGAYLVCETSSTGATIGETGESVQITSNAAPFIVTIPTPYEKGWIYDLHAFPKNLGFVPATKSIQMQELNGLVMGDTVKFPVRIVIPAMEGGAAWPTGAVSDVFDPRLVPVDGGVESVKILKPDGNVAYTFSEDDPAPEYEVVTNANGVAVVFTPAGLAVFNGNAHAGNTVEVLFAAKVTALGEGDTSGVIENRAGIWTDPSAPFDPETSDWNDAPVETNEVTTRWGQALILKYADDAAKTPLAGAEFELFDAADPYPETGTCAANAEPSALLQGLTSDNNGEVNIPGLFVSDSVNDTKDATFRCYVLKETKAPAGYVLPSNSYHAVKVTVGAETEYNVQILNTQQSVPALPITGAAGKLLLTLAGISAGAVVLGLVLVNKRRTEAALK